MPKKGVEKRHSETALFAALYRAVANKESNNEKFGPDYLAEYFLPFHFRFFIKFKKIRVNVKNKSDKFTPGAYEYMLARTAYFDQVFRDALDKNTPQIVLLGAGYDTRAYRFAKLNSATKIIELDMAPTQNRKMKCLKKAQIDIPKNVTFAPIDFNRESLKDVLENAGYENNEKTLFLWEGVSYYLDPQSVDATLGFIKDSSHHESAIAFDYAISVTDETIGNYFGVKEFIQTWKKHRKNELFRFTIDEGEIESFLEQRGLRIVNHLDNREIEKTFLLDENGSLMGQITGWFRFVTASSNNDQRT